jgi:hypothetical protein
MDIARIEPQATRSMDYRDDARTEELNNLKLALATFALQLDAFEMRMGRARLTAEIEPGIRLPPPPDIGRRLKRENVIGGQ